MNKNIFFNKARDKYSGLFFIFWETAKRDLSKRYKGSWFGIFWSFINPILLLIVYSFVFGVIFKARWPEASAGSINYSLILFCGLITHIMFADVLSRSSALIVENSNYVKKVVFPLHVFGMATVSSASFHFFISTLIVIAYALYLGVFPSINILYFPLILINYIIFLLGVSWIVSSLGVFFRDINYIVGFLTTALMFLSPIFYSSDSVPDSFSFVMNINPLTYYIEAFRSVVIYGEPPSLSASIVAMIVSAGTFLIGLNIFNKLYKSFSDVL